MRKTYSLLTPVLGAPNYVEAFLVLRTQDSRRHDIVLGQPYLQLLVPSPLP
jgi:hypothetical protein